MPEQLLTPRQRKFLEHYLINGMPVAAARAAGYAERTANHQAKRILETASMQKALEGEQERVTAIQTANLTDDQARQVEVFTSREQILSHFERIRSEAQQKGDHTTELRALELLGRANAMFTERREVVTGGLSDYLQQLSQIENKPREKVVN